MNCECEKRHVIGCRNVKEPFPKAAPKRLRQQSDKRKALAPVRKAFVDRKLAKDKRCQVCPVIMGCKDLIPLVMTGLGLPACTGRATEVHEPLTRKRAPGAETILDEENSLSCCHDGHFWIHQHPALSEAMGLLRSSRGLGGK